ncbi:MAG: hypothetical protein R3C11_16240 [Planctomycetaceae bacterium]
MYLMDMIKRLAHIEMTPGEQCKFMYKLGSQPAVYYVWSRFPEDESKNTWTMFLHFEEVPDESTTQFEVEVTLPAPKAPTSILKKGARFTLTRGQGILATGIILE